MKMIVGPVCLSLTVTTQKVNACSPWTHCLLIFIKEFMFLSLSFLFLMNYQIYATEY